MNVRSILVALAGLVWSCGGEAKLPPGKDFQSNGALPVGDSLMLPETEIKLALSSEKDIALIRVLDIQEKDPGRRGYRTEYEISVLKSVMGGKRKMDCFHWGHPELEKAQYIVILGEKIQSWGGRERLTVKVSDSEANAVFEAHRNKVDKILGSIQLLPDSVLIAANSGSLSIVVANLNMGAGSTEGVQPGAPWNCLLYVKETLAGNATGNFTVAIKGPVSILPGLDYLLGIRPDRTEPQELVAVEAYPVNRKRQVKLNLTRMRELNRK